MDVNFGEMPHLAVNFPLHVAVTIMNTHNTIASHELHFVIQFTVLCALYMHFYPVALQ